MRISIPLAGGPNVSTSAVSKEADQVKATRKSWRRVAKRVLRSKNGGTRNRWSERLKVVSKYMTRRLQQAGKKKTASKKLRDQIEYSKKQLALYKRIIDALGRQYSEGMEKLADIKIPLPGTDIKLKPSEEAVAKTPKAKKPKPKPVLKPKAEPSADVARRGRIRLRAKALKKAVKEKFDKGVKIMTLFEDARDKYATTKSAASKQRMELTARRLGEIKTEISKAKRKRDQYLAKHKSEMA